MDGTRHKFAWQMHGKLHGKPARKFESHFGEHNVALKIVQPGDGRNLQISGTVEKDGKLVRFRRSARTKDVTTALMRAREYERQIFGLLPSVDTLRMALEMIVLLAESGQARELPRILSVAEKALALLPKSSD